MTVQYKVCDDLHAACRNDVFKVHEDSLGRFWSEIRNRRGVRHCANLNHGKCIFHISCSASSYCTCVSNIKLKSRGEVSAPGVPAIPPVKLGC